MNVLADQRYLEKRGWSMNLSNASELLSLVEDFLEDEKEGKV